ncbi:hypothetical protein FA15DRAFT_222540 [Coprinopsis marcescibilis]|uniref:Uncharacterized protein n=1 Tax=Coprinopsis marcescibilis TaxID=230819 RepID=A0A5C3KH29_COPMA|nr:hypothetical protein FA15DRAFT_222540 [Coprinopsis marcescibilis]
MGPWPLAMWCIKLQATTMTASVERLATLVVAHGHLFPFSLHQQAARGLTCTLEILTKVEKDKANNSLNTNLSKSPQEQLSPCPSPATTHRLHKMLHSTTTGSSLDCGHWFLIKVLPTSPSLAAAAAPPQDFDILTVRWVAKRIEPPPPAKNIMGHRHVVDPGASLSDQINNGCQTLKIFLLSGTCFCS